MDRLTVAVFAAVYAGLALGRVPGLRLDRTGIALVGAIVLLAAGRLDTEAAWRAIDAPTIGLLFGLMVVSAQLRLGGFYTAVTARLAAAAASPERLLGLTVALAGALAAVLSNDVVCLAMTPVLIDGCARRGLDPVPFVLATAAAANVGSVATLIGNPQNMLIGAALDLDFVDYLVLATPPAVLGLLVVWWWVARIWRGRMHRPVQLTEVPTLRAFDTWQATKGLAVLAAVMVLFVGGDAPREVVALGAAGLLLLSRRMHTREMLGLVDWQLCVLFAGLFVLHDAFRATGAVDAVLARLDGTAADPRDGAALFAWSVLLSNVVSNVPAVMLLLPACDSPRSGALLALGSTLAGNLVLVGSIANLIVVDTATRLGVAPLGRSWFRAHLAVGVPITALTLAIAAGWVALAG